MSYDNHLRNTRQTVPTHGALYNIPYLYKASRWARFFLLLPCKKYLKLI